jgi:hypothetical protein
LKPAHSRVFSNYEMQWANNAYWKAEVSRRASVILYVILKIKLLFLRFSRNPGAHLSAALDRILITEGNLHAHTKFPTFSP